MTLGDIPRPPASQRVWVNTQAEIPLAWPDDEIMLAAELRTDENALERAQRFVRAGHVPQLRMALAPGDTINDYLRALGDPDALMLIKRRAAVAKWNDGGASGSPNGKGDAYRPPDLPYLRQMLAFTYDDTRAYREQSQPALDQVEDDVERADYQHEPKRGRGEQ